MSTVSGATARRVAVRDMRTYLFWMEGKYDLAKEWGKRGVEFKAASQIDTGHDCSHNLALARRDSGEVDEALSYFLHGASLDEVVNPRGIVANRGGSFFGNIGRCLVFKGDFDNALICLIKSAVLLEKQRDELTLMNQGWAAHWLGELFEKRQDSRMAFICYKRASNKWKPVSPPRSEQAAEAALRLSTKDANLLRLEDWAVERAYTDWLKKVDNFVPAT